MKFMDIAKMGEKELDAKLSELRGELVKLNSQVATGTQLKSPGQIRNIKRTIAKILTIKKMESNKA